MFCQACVSCVPPPLPDASQTSMQVFRTYPNLTSRASCKHEAILRNRGIWLTTRKPGPEISHQGPAEYIRMSSNLIHPCGGQARSVRTSSRE
ncbi:hypothetical protein Agabi119p4_5742 [Agaricus bisporus var. burnettii]|uniref:Uncharacterized protein n=1 Tax=Agaricus bisporus var. burnettii TaxID=192524 RepID=A0A8H7KGG2_AGABI|nr:hypothetical protein Agabi119p4_5742 [Agaricus bisporus var. burnettii]